MREPARRSRSPSRRPTPRITPRPPPRPRSTSRKRRPRSRGRSRHYHLRHAAIIDPARCDRVLDRRWLESGCRRHVHVQPGHGRGPERGQQQALSVSFTPSDTSDYNSTSATATMTSTRRRPPTPGPIPPTSPTARRSAHSNSTPRIGAARSRTPRHSGRCSVRETACSRSPSCRPTPRTTPRPPARRRSASIKRHPDLLGRSTPTSRSGAAILAQLNAMASVPGSSAPPGTGTFY